MKGIDFALKIYGPLKIAKLWGQSNFTTTCIHWLKTALAWTFMHTFRYQILYTSDIKWYRVTTVNSCTCICINHVVCFSFVKWRLRGTTNLLSWNWQRLSILMTSWWPLDEFYTPKQTKRHVSPPLDFDIIKSSLTKILHKILTSI